MPHEISIDESTKLSRNSSYQSDSSTSQRDMGLRSRTPGPTETEFKHGDGLLDRGERSGSSSPVDGFFARSPGLSRIPTGALSWSDGEEEASKSIFYLAMLTLSIAGLQIAYAVETANGSPFLLSLGMSKSLLALVWIAGPVAGVIVQPYVGIRSDNCRISWGKRRPFMIGGAFGTAVCLLGLAWTREIVHGFFGLFGADRESEFVKVCAIIWATVLIYVLDFAINTVQAAIRAFIVDNAPSHQQETANAWASRISGIGNIIGYLAGNADLPKEFPFLGHTQFQVFCAIACIVFCGTVLLSSAYVKERDPRLEGAPALANPGVFSFFRQTIDSIHRLPPQIRKVCEAQFFNWLAWFAFLYYQTTYVGQLEVNPYFASHPDLSPAESDKAWEDAIRVGTYALLLFAIVSFIGAILLPFIVAPSYTAPTSTKSLPSAHSNSLSASMSSIFPLLPSPGAPLSVRLYRLLEMLQIPWLTLRRAWLLSHIMFALCMFSTIFITTPRAATILTAVIGIPWALSMWAPFALIAAEISQRDAEGRQRKNQQLSNSGRNGAAAAGSKDEVEDQAGVILGLHNVAISAPQILATLISSAIFHMTQKPRGAADDDSVGWVMRASGLAALVAAYYTWRISEQRQSDGGGAYQIVEEGRGRR